MDYFVEIQQKPEVQKGEKSMIDLIIGGSIGGGLLILAVLIFVVYVTLKCTHAPKKKPSHVHDYRSHYPGYSSRGYRTNTGRPFSITRAHFS